MKRVLKVTRFSNDNMTTVFLWTLQKYGHTWYMVVKWRCSIVFKLWISQGTQLNEIKRVSYPLVEVKPPNGWQQKCFSIRPPIHRTYDSCKSPRLYPLRSEWWGWKLVGIRCELSLLVLHTSLRISMAPICHWNTISDSTRCHNLRPRLYGLGYPRQPFRSRQLCGAFIWSCEL